MEMTFSLENNDVPMEKGAAIQPAAGKLGVLTPGMGAVTTTFIAGVEAVRRGLAKPIGSLTQMGTVRLGKRTDNRSPKIQDFVPLARLDDLVFGGWDIFGDNVYEAAAHAGVLEPKLLDSLRQPLEVIRPMPAVFEQRYVPRLRATQAKQGRSKMELAEQLMDDIAQFRERSGASRLVMVWCGSTETYQKAGVVH